jgi:hypothetical protein
MPRGNSNAPKRLVSETAPPLLYVNLDQPSLLYFTRRLPEIPLDRVRSCAMPRPTFALRDFAFCRDMRLVVSDKPDRAPWR